MVCIVQSFFLVLYIIYPSISSEKFVSAPFLWQGYQERAVMMKKKKKKKRKKNVCENNLPD